MVLGTAKEIGATPYEMPGAEMGHDGEQCSFDTFLRKYKPRNPALQQFTIVVRGADSGHLDLAPRAAGLLAISPGLLRDF